MGSVAEFDKAIELDPRQKACMFLIFFPWKCESLYAYEYIMINL